MKRLMIAANVLLLCATFSFGQQYTIKDLGTIGKAYSVASGGLNASGQVAGYITCSIYESCVRHAFRTAANSPINPATDDLGTLGGSQSLALGINASGQVTGWSDLSNLETHAFRTAGNSPIHPDMDDLGTLGGSYSDAFGINASGQVVGRSSLNGEQEVHAFRTAPNKAINPASDDLGTLGGVWSWALAINDSGQVVGYAWVSGDLYHAFRTAANSPINPATDDLGTLGGSYSKATDINASGQVVGESRITGDTAIHAFRTAANRAINPATDDLGTLGGSESGAFGINASGQVVGYSRLSGDAEIHPFLYSNGVMHDLNDLIPTGSGWILLAAYAINDAGQIAANGYHPPDVPSHALLLTPVHIPYKAFVQPPINSDSSSTFRANRGVVPVKFTLTENEVPTCNLPPATIAVTRTAGGTLGAVDESVYEMAADVGSNFRIDPSACQYIYNLPARALSVGTYRVDVIIEANTVGNAVFELNR